MIEMTSTKNTICQGGTRPTLTARMGTGGNQVNAVYDPSVHHDYRQFDDVSETVRSRYGTGGNNQPLVVANTEPVANGNGQLNQIAMSDKANALDTMHDQQAVVIGAKCADDYKGPNRQYVDDRKCQITNGTVRRLTSLECERLQGYPDGWTAIPGASDSAKYKALGNSIALPFWEHLAHRFAEIGNVKTIGSLFDGIGGFPLVFKRAGAETLWTSEIEPFCQKVVEWHVANGDL